MKIHEQITPETWRKNGLWDSRYPLRLDITEWLLRIYPAPNCAAAYAKMCEVTGRATKGPESSMSFWNDEKGRTFDEVREAFRKADL